MNPSFVDIQTDNGSVVLTLKHRALWFMDQHGVLVYKMVTGNFRITAVVHTRKPSDPAQPPGGDSSVQLAGLMVRSRESGANENYAFIVVGDDGDGLSVETKNTVNSLSRYDGPAWNSAEADLRLCRVGTSIGLYKRHVDGNDAWALAASYDRPDLPDTLQAGMNIYTNAEPDVQARFDDLQIEPVSSPAECVQD